MQPCPVFSMDALPPADAGGTVMIGNFDGVHKGHQAVLAAARGLSRPLTVLSFEPHPRRFFAFAQKKDLPPFRLSDAARKAALLKRYGADNVVLLRFDAALATLPAALFVERVLAGGFAPRHVCVGADFAFGAGRGGTVETLRAAGRQVGFEVTAISPVMDDSGLPYASTRVRAAVAAGDFSLAEKLMGHAWCLSGPVRPGARRGRSLGYPTANVTPGGGDDPLLLPPYGVYAVRARIEGDARWHDAVANLGIRPMFRPMFRLQAPLLETHVLATIGDIYGKKITVRPVAFLRPEMFFDTPVALSTQMEEDCKRARSVLKSALAAGLKEDV